MSEEYRTFEAGLGLIESLPLPVYFRYKDGLGLSTHPQIGYLAQEVEEVFPEAVFQDWRSPQGEVPEDTRAINYVPIIALLCNAVRQLGEIVKAQDQQIAALAKLHDNERQE